MPEFMERWWINGSEHRQTWHIEHTMYNSMVSWHETALTIKKVESKHNFSKQCPGMWGERDSCIGTVAGRMTRISSPWPSPMSTTWKSLSGRGKLTGLRRLGRGSRFLGKHLRRMMLAMKMRHSSSRHSSESWHKEYSTCTPSASINAFLPDPAKN